MYLNGSGTRKDPEAASKMFSEAKKLSSLLASSDVSNLDNYIQETHDIIEAIYYSRYIENCNTATADHNKALTFAKFFASISTE